MKTIFSFALLFLAFGVTSVHADNDHDGYSNQGYNYQSYYYGGYSHPESGHSHNSTSGLDNHRPWYHTHDGIHHFHNIANGHTDHTRPYTPVYYAYRPELNDDWVNDYRMVQGQRYPGRPTMGYGRSTTTTHKNCDCDHKVYRRY